MTRKIAAFDVETDPFRKDRAPLPFACEFWDGTIRKWFWGDDCIEQFVAWLNTLEDEYIIYAHNGGRFDFFYILEHLSNKIKIINRRIVKCWIGIQEFRDSWVIMPEPLASFPGQNQKLKIDYDKFEREVREDHKEEILYYLHIDCVVLYDNVKAFWDEFGDHLTIGGLAMKELRKRHNFKTGDERFDDEIRPYYFGGRCQCFKSGIIHGDYKVYDVNGMYQYVMREYLHPSSTTYSRNNVLNDRTDFARIRARNYGALPVRTELGGISFDVEYGEFLASIHEINAGLETGTLEIIDVIETFEFHERTRFAKFIDHFTREKLAAELRGDKMHRAFYKRVQNASYGKFAQNPRDFKDYTITKGEYLDDPWELTEQNGDFFIWEKPSSRNKTGYLNVATAASITGASRALLLRGLCNAVDPLYCDTDSIICLGLNMEIDSKKLGAFKLEGEGEEMAIAGKKLYALFAETEEGVQETIKHASKGARLTGEEIRKIANGERIVFHNPVPHFKLGGGARFISRNLVSTAKPGRIGAR